MWQVMAAALVVLSRGAASSGPSPLRTTPPGPASAFVHLFEWSWADVAKECEDWLGPKQFTAVQISPPNDHLAGGEWWVRYQPVTYNLTSRSGDEAAFIDMVQRCKKAGVGVYVDAVINHIAGGGGAAGRASIAGNPIGDRSTPIYSQEDMHHSSGNPDSNCGVNNYDDKFNVQYCDLEGLPDLCTACGQVRDRIAAYLMRLLQLGATGLRIDAAKHQDAGELGAILAKVPEAYIFQEVISGVNEAVRPDMYFSLGQVTEFNYGRQVAPNFVQDGKLQYLGNVGEPWGFMPAASAVVFLDNHDTQRGKASLTYKNGKLYELATVFMLAHPYGYPKVMSSYQFSSHDQGPPATPVHPAGGGAPECNSPPSGPGLQGSAPWVCEHRWPAVANMVAWRRAAGDGGVEHFQVVDGDRIAFCRSQAACIAMNRQEQATWSATVKFSVPPGRYCNVIESDDPGACPAVEVAGDGSVTLEVPPLSAAAVHVGKRAASSAELGHAGTRAEATRGVAGTPGGAAGSLEELKLALRDRTGHASWGPPGVAQQLVV